MKLSRDQIDRTAQHLIAKCKDFGCPACGGVDWMIDDNLWTLPSPPAAAAGGIVTARDIGQAQAPPIPVFSPLVQLICQGCCFVTLFGAAAMGLLSPARPGGEEKGS